jgi:conjugative relaxase-like TrwC/TraI family protein
VVRRTRSALGLIGEVREDHFQRLAEGQHPITGEQLVRHQTARETGKTRGERVTTMEHRAGWDATFSAPKSVSLTALVGGDERVREARRESVRVALNELAVRAGAARRQPTSGNHYGLIAPGKELPRLAVYCFGMGTSGPESVVYRQRRCR